MKVASTKKVKTVNVLGSIPPQEEGTFAWQPQTMKYFGEVYLSAQDGSVSGLTFNSTGTKMYTNGYSNDKIYQYSLSTAWNVTTAKYDFVSLSIVTQSGQSRGIYLSTDNLHLYVTDISAVKIFQYDLSTASDLSTATYSGKYVSLTGVDATPYGVTFKPDGTKMYVTGGTNDSIYCYNLSTAWDLSTATYVNSKSVTAQDTTPVSTALSPDGKTMLMLGFANRKIFQYNLSTAWDLSTATYTSRFYTISGIYDSTIYSLFVKPDGYRVYLLGNQNDLVCQYSMGYEPNGGASFPIEDTVVQNDTNSILNANVSFLMHFNTRKDGGMYEETTKRRFFNANTSIGSTHTNFGQAITSLGTTTYPQYMINPNRRLITANPYPDITLLHTADCNLSFWAKFATGTNMLAANPFLVLNWSEYSSSDYSYIDIIINGTDLVLGVNLGIVSSSIYQQLVVTLSSSYFSYDEWHYYSFYFPANTGAGTKYATFGIDGHTGLTDAITYQFPIAFYGPFYIYIQPNCYIDELTNWFGNNFGHNADFTPPTKPWRLV